ncbi:hypothetical protein CHS0354_002459 [Potamilus streckersoni]|uniref:Uncharacterized protein n=1 Tax=Potamilus streckersoni TaxID=2493646 RepID=A0AAE0T8N7_9BIVA|nr:hypothetical protein CHS0354_002459 [Potamilus streckersoni]
MWEQQIHIIGSNGTVKYYSRRNGSSGFVFQEKWEQRNRIPGKGWLGCFETQSLLGNIARMEERHTTAKEVMGFTELAWTGVLADEVDFFVGGLGWVGLDPGDVGWVVCLYVWLE